jgi:hypothetical protein
MERERERERVTDKPPDVKFLFRNAWQRQVIVATIYSPRVNESGGNEEFRDFHEWDMAHVALREAHASRVKRE